MDSSAFIKYFFIEKGSKWINGIFAPASNNLLFVSQIAEIELSSAFSRRVREGSLTPAIHTKLVGQYRYQQLLVLRVVNIEDDVTQNAGQLTLTRALRANDTLQLASALKTNRELINLGSPSLTFISSDVRLLAAAQAEGLSADNPENYP